MKTYPAIVLAGYSPDTPDPLAAAMGGERKALLDVAGHPMVYWVVKALRDSGCIDRIVVVGIEAEDGVDFGGDVIYVPNQKGQFDNALAGVLALQEDDPTTDYLISSSADIPMLRAESIAWFVEEAEKLGADFIYSIVEDKVMESQFPDSARSFIPMPEGRFCGGDLFMVRARVARNNEQLVRDLIDNRKNALRQVWLAGIGTVIKFLFRRLTIPEAEKVAAKLLNCDTRAIPSPYADLGMDVDKPDQLELVRKLKAEEMTAT